MYSLKAFTCGKSRHTDGERTPCPPFMTLPNPSDERYDSRYKVAKFIKCLVRKRAPSNELSQRSVPNGSPRILLRDIGYRGIVRGPPATKQPVQNYRKGTGHPTKSRFRVPKEKE